ncbi:MAG: peptide deformylase [bacterium]|nr:peptide deformylase [bacterium]
MTILRIRKYGDLILKKRCEMVRDEFNNIKRLIDDMFETMYANLGIGLAANQVGVLKRVIVTDVGTEGARKPIYLINPEIIEMDGEEILEEGCLSLPEIKGEVKRKKRVFVRGLDTEGKVVKIDTIGILARAIQHEIDHLDGILFIDRMDKNQKKALSLRLNKLRKATKRELRSLSEGK